MTDTMITGLIAPVMLALVSAFVGYVKYMFSKRDKKEAEEMAERDRRRDEIERAINELKIENKKLQAILLGCEHEDCPAKRLLAEYYEAKINKN